MQTSLENGGLRPALACNALRFGRKIPMSTLGRLFYRVSNFFLTMQPRADHFIQKRLIDQAPKGFQWFGKGLRRFVTGTRPLDYDYERMSTLSWTTSKHTWSLGDIVSNPPAGAMLAVMYGGMMGGRLKNAFKRIQEGDYREVRDILIRDVPTILLMVYAFDPSVHWLCEYLGKWRGLQMLHDKKVLSHDELRRFYTVQDANRLEAILADKLNHKGVIRALDKVMNSRHMGREQVDKLKTLKNLLQRAILEENGSSAFRQLTGKAFAVMEELEASRMQALRHGFVEKFRGHMADRIPPFKSMFANYAKRIRFAADSLALVWVIALLGWGVVKFNQWYTEREFSRLRHERYRQHLKARTTSSGDIPLQTVSPKAVSTAFSTPMIANPNGVKPFSPN